MIYENYDTAFIFSDYDSFANKLLQGRIICFHP